MDSEFDEDEDKPAEISDKEDSKSAIDKLNSDKLGGSDKAESVKA